MKITHIIYSFNTGGAETMLVDIMNHQSELGHNISLIIINKSYNKSLLQEISNRVSIIFINRPVGSKNPYYILKLNFLILKLKPKVIHSHSSYIINLLFLNKTPKYLTLHGIGIIISKNRYDKYFAISKSVKDDILNRYNIDSTIINNGVNPEKIKKNIILNNNKNFSIIQIGGLNIVTKGQDLLIKAISYIRKRYNIIINVSFIGDGIYYEELTNLVKELNLQDCIKFLGLKSREYIYINIHKYNLLVQPSRKEGFGLTIVEGMLAKIPVLVSDIDAPMSIIGKGTYGFYFKNNSYKDLAERICKIYKMNNKILSKKTELAYYYAFENFDINKTVKRYLQEYE